MTSDGGLTKPQHFTGSKAIVSGPSGGVIGYSETTTQELGEETQIIGFDMGGTSTDVSRFHHGWENQLECLINGVLI